MLAVATDSKKRFEWLTSFLKRRWILLSCAFVVATLTCCDFRFLRIRRLPPEVQEVGQRDFFYVVEETGISNGELVRDYVSLWEPPSLPMAFTIHRPAFGQWPVFSKSELRIPLWLPLSVLLGWIVIRELSWREKRAKADDAME